MRVKRGLITSIFLTITSLSFAQTGIVECVYPLVEEVSPHFPGGDDSLASFVAQNLKWPSHTWCGEGNVYIQFTVDTLGQIKDPKVLRGIDSTADQAALRVITIMPNWIPGKDLDGNKITRTMYLPIKFTLR